MDHFCLDCNALLKGRTDKKFCGDQCRSNYHNNLKTGDLIFINLVNRILKKNRAILKSQNPLGKIRVKTDSLLRKGFDFNFHTHTHVTQKGNNYYFCYEYGYLLLGNGEALLVKRTNT